VANNKEFIDSVKRHWPVVVSLGSANPVVFAKASRALDNPMWMAVSLAALLLITMGCLIFGCLCKVERTSTILGAPMIRKWLTPRWAFGLLSTMAAICFVLLIQTLAFVPSSQFQPLLVRDVEVHMPQRTALNGKEYLTGHIASPQPLKD